MVYPGHLGRSAVLIAHPPGGTCAPRRNACAPTKVSLRQWWSHVQLHSQLPLLSLRHVGSSRRSSRRFGASNIAGALLQRRPRLQVLLVVARTDLQRRPRLQVLLEVARTDLHSVCPPEGLLPLAGSWRSHRPASAAAAFQERRR